MVGNPIVHYKQDLHQQMIANQRIQPGERFGKRYENIFMLRKGEPISFGSLDWPMAETNDPEYIHDICYAFILQMYSRVYPEDYLRQTLVPSVNILYETLRRHALPGDIFMNAASGGWMSRTMHEFAQNFPECAFYHFDDFMIKGTRHCSLEPLNQSHYGMPDFYTIVMSNGEFDVEDERFLERYVQQRATKYPQEKCVFSFSDRPLPTTLPDQDFDIFVVGQVSRDANVLLVDSYYRDSDEMCLCLAKQFPEKRVVYKPHPMENCSLNEELWELDNVHISSAPIHDIFDRVEEVYTIGSGVGIEAQLHGKKVNWMSSSFYANFDLSTKERQCQFIHACRQYMFPRGQMFDIIMQKESKVNRHTKRSDLPSESKHSDKPIAIHYHYGFGDCMIAFSATQNLIHHNPHRDIYLLFPEHTKGMFEFFTWPENVHLVAGKPLGHDFNNQHNFMLNLPEWKKKIDNGEVEYHNLTPKNTLQYPRVKFQYYNKDIKKENIAIIQPLTCDIVPRHSRQEAPAYREFLKNLIDSMVEVGLTVALVGSQKDAEECKLLGFDFDGHPGVLNKMGKTSIREMCELVNKSIFVCGVESMVSILGGLLEIPTVCWLLRDYPPEPEFKIMIPELGVNAFEAKPWNSLQINFTNEMLNQEAPKKSQVDQSKLPIKNKPNSNQIFTTALGELQQLIGE